MSPLLLLLIPPVKRPGKNLCLPTGELDMEDLNLRAWLLCTNSSGPDSGTILKKQQSKMCPAQILMSSDPEVSVEMEVCAASSDPSFRWWSPGNHFLLALRGKQWVLVTFAFLSKDAGRGETSDGSPGKLGKPPQVETLSAGWPRCWGLNLSSLMQN